MTTMELLQVARDMFDSGRVAASYRVMDEAQPNCAYLGRTSRESNEITGRAIRTMISHHVRFYAPFIPARAPEWQCIRWAIRWMRQVELMEWVGTLEEVRRLRGWRNRRRA